MVGRWIEGYEEGGKDEGKRRQLWKSKTGRRSARVWRGCLPECEEHRPPMRRLQWVYYH